MPSDQADFCQLCRTECNISQRKEAQLKINTRLLMYYAAGVAGLHQLSECNDKGTFHE